MKKPIKKPNQKAPDLEWLDFIFKAGWHKASNLKNKLGNSGITKKRRNKLLALVADRELRLLQHDRLERDNQADLRRPLPPREKVSKHESRKNRAARKFVQAQRVKARPSERRISLKRYLRVHHIVVEGVPLNYFDVYGMGVAGLELQARYMATLDGKACPTFNQPCKVVERDAEGTPTRIEPLGWRGKKPM